MKNTLLRGIFYVVIITGCTNHHANNSTVSKVTTNKDTVFIDNSVIDEAKRIIARAIEIVQYVPDKHYRENLTIALQSMKVFTTAQDGSLQLNFKESQFSIVITDPSHLRPPRISGSQATFMQFDNEVADEYHCFVIVMNKNIASLVKNNDGKACILIHELIHAMQANDLISHGQKASKSLHYYREQEAWEGETYLYTGLHPEILKIQCNCNDFSVSFPKDVSYLSDDHMSIGYALYQSCKDKYLQTLYDKNQ